MAKRLKLGIRAALLAWLALPLAVSAASTPTGDATFDRSVSTIRSEVVLNPEVGLARTAALAADARRLPADKEGIGLAAAQWLRAEALIRVNRMADAARVTNAALALARRVAPNTKLHGDLLIAHGGASSGTGAIQQALQDYQAAFRIFRQANEPRSQAIALLNIGAIYRDASDYQSALKYAEQAVEAYSQDPSLQLTAYNNSGNALVELGQPRRAAIEFRRALQAAREMGSPLLEVRVLQNIARAQTYAHDYDAADATLTQAFALAANGPAASWRPALYGIAALVAQRRGQLDRAASLVERAIADADSAPANIPLIDFHHTAYEIFRERGEQAKALKHLEIFKKLDDEKRTLAASTSAALMSARFDFANQQSKISQLQKSEAESQAAALQARENYLLVLLVGAALVSGLLLVGIFTIRRSRNQVRAANADLQVSNVSLEKALAAKTEFLATTSHEIRTPLNGILGMTQVILADRSVPPSLRSRVELVHGAGETMRALVDDILDVAKMETGELRLHPVEMDLTRLLSEAGQVWAGQAQTKKLTIAMDTDGAPPAILADEVRLRQIVFNLMSNAIKFTDRGTVTLSATTRDDGDGGERLLIAVQDSGIGIPEERLEDIFESFRQVDGGVTRRHGGTGLGLAICRSLARAMGGDVRVTSVIGAGSTFTVDLPLTRVEAMAVAMPKGRRGAGTLKDAEMLLVEANPLSQGILRALLGPHVARLVVVGDAAEAIEAAAGDFDHVLADGGTLGLDVDAARRLAVNASAAGARVTILWPAPSAETAAALDEWGIQLIAKPVSAPDLLAALQMVYQPDEASRDVAA